MNISTERNWLPQRIPTHSMCPQRSKSQNHCHARFSGNVGYLKKKTLMKLADLCLRICYINKATAQHGTRNTGQLG